MSVAIIILIVIILISVWKLFINKHPVDQLPGPLALPLIGNALQLLKPMDEILDTFSEFAIKYKPLYRMWFGTQPIVVPLEPDDVEVVMSSSKHIRKSFEYETVIAQWLGEGLLTSGGSKWHSRRKMLTPTFHFQILEQFIPIFSSQTKILLKILNTHVGKQEGVDIAPLVTRCALDIICETAMGTNVHAQENSDSKYVKEIYELNDLIVQRMLRPWLHNDILFAISSSGRRSKQLVKSLHAFTDKVIRERRQELRKAGNKAPEENKQEDELKFGSRKKAAFLDLLLSVSEKDPSLTDSDIREEVDTFMFEGHDTTAMAMSWACYFLGAYPVVQEKCMEELREIFGDSDRDPTYTDLGAMKYLERVIKETLRLRPSVFLIARKVEQNIKLGGKEFPAGTVVQLHISQIHLNPKIFPDPQKFDPDRFSPDNCQGRHPYSYIPFSAGPRNCIGQKFAMLEMKNLLSTVLRHFRLETINHEFHYRALPDLILRPKYGVQVRIYNR